MKTIDRMTIAGIMAFIMTISAIGLFYVIILNKLGGNEALFAILGYIAGWMSSIVLFLFPKNKDPETK